MLTDRIPILRWLFVNFTSDESERTFLERKQSQSQGDVDVAVAVLDARESQRFFCVKMARRGIQPIWIAINNRSDRPQRLSLLSVDRNYYSPLEAAAANHFSTGNRWWAFGILAWLFLPLILLLPVRIFMARRANRKMDAYFQRHAFRLRPIMPRSEAEGFVFTPLDSGSKVVHVKLMGPGESTEMIFTVPVPGFDADYLRHDIQDHYSARELIDCDIKTLQQHLAEAPCTTSNVSGMRQGDPVNLVVAGEFQTVLSAFGARWDETETISLGTCWKTFRAFLMGSEYRYSPVSPLYLYGRSQDFALQRIRQSINERLHLRLWATPLRLEGVPVWIGQISRDIGVRFTWQTWNLTTHRIDPDVDEARDYVIEDLLEAERLEMAGYVDGVGRCDMKLPRHNLTGDPYYTDGRRAAMLLSPTRTTPKFIAWS